MTRLKTVALLLLCLSLPCSSQEETDELNVQEASRLARLPLAGLSREYPNKLDHVMNGPDQVLSPLALHPVFYGSYDWHSSVHGHWMLVRLLKLHPDLPEAGASRALLDHHLTPERVAVELSYLGQENRQSFERPYGWGWLLKLCQELHEWNHPDARRWEEALTPLSAAIAQRYIDFFPKQTYPIRSGVHSNSALGLAFALDFARSTGHQQLEELVVGRSLSYFEQDRDYPAAWEPDGDHFLSPALTEADLMRRVLSPSEFAGWLERFLPGLAEGNPASLLAPVQVSDRSDPKIVHLDGLNLSRGWAMKGVASALPADHPAREILLSSARIHGEAALDHVTSGDYAGEHWLASFAVYYWSAAQP